MKALKVITLTILMFAIGMTGLFLFFSDHENLVLLILSKPAGIGLIWLSYKLQVEIERISIYNN